MPCISNLLWRVESVMKYYLKQVFKQQVQQSLSGAEVVCIFGKKGGRFKRSLARGGCSTDGQAVSGRSKRREQSCCPLRAQCSCPPIADSNWTKSCAKSNLPLISSSLVGGKSFLPKWAGGLVRQQKGRSSWFTELFSTDTMRDHLLFWSGCLNDMLLTGSWSQLSKDHISIFKVSPSKDRKL